MDKKTNITQKEREEVDIMLGKMYEAYHHTMNPKKEEPIPAFALLDHKTKLAWFNVFAVASDYTKDMIEKEIMLMTEERAKEASKKYSPPIILTRENNIPPNP